MVFSATLDTGLHADGVKFWHGPGSNGMATAVFSCYELQEEKDRRAGSLVLAAFDSERAVVAVADRLEGIPGVFDMKWFQGQDLLGLAVAEGTPQFVRVSETGLERVVEGEREACKLDSMALCIAGETGTFVTGDNCGFLHSWSLGSATLERGNSFRAHDAEIWYASFDSRSGLLFTGSDDCVLKAWDARCANNASDAVFCLKGKHEAGVCCVEASPWTESHFLSASYDERLRLWDRRQLKTALCEIGCGSGVWRAAWHPSERDIVAVAAMRVGFGIVDVSLGSLVQKESVEEAVVGYGIDWHPNGEWLASCTFYNNQGQFWRYRNKGTNSII
jgi:diphthamide biosynthesis protein 7